jgi:glucosyl-3-phosphoglycerate synthase
LGGGKLNGRVTRLLVSLLLISLKKVVGGRNYIDYLRSFRYPLSGEFAMRRAILPDLRTPPRLGAGNRGAVRGLAQSGAQSRL